MTHNDIITKFLIEYDKADVTSSYPSLTTYEVATILDKAYLALIGQKVTGNNIRRAGFETDIKAISDLQSLIWRENLETIGQDYNANVYNLPSDFLYFVSLRTFLRTDKQQGNGRMYGNSFNGEDFAKLIDHNTALKFMVSHNNIPWVKNPVCYIDSNQIIVISDPKLIPEGQPDLDNWHTQSDVFLTYIKVPAKFALSNAEVDTTSAFELNDQMAEELISLAVAFALENVESTRLNSKLNTRGLEA